MALCMLINYGSAKLMPILILSTTTAGAAIDVQIMSTFVWKKILP